MNRSLTAISFMLSLFVWACSPGDSPRQASAESVNHSMEGAWRRAEIVFEMGPDAGTHTLDVQPSVYIFAKSHYAISAVNGFTPRPFLGENPTIEDSGRAFAPLTGNTGTYTSEGGKLILAPLTAKNPVNMDGATKLEYDISWAGNDLWLINTTPENGEVRTRLTRLPEDASKVTPATQRLQGVWRRAEMIVGAGPDTGTHLADVQPGFYIFTPNHFAANYVSAFAPRPLLSEKPTDEERGKIFTPFASFAGTYTASDDGNLMLTPVVSKTPNNMRGRPFQPVAMEWAGNDVWFIFSGEDGSENRTRLTPVTD